MIRRPPPPPGDLSPAIEPPCGGDQLPDLQRLHTWDRKRDTLYPPDAIPTSSPLPHAFLHFLASSLDQP